MKVLIELNTADHGDVATLDRFFGTAPVEAPAKGKRAAKPVEAVAVNPDKQPEPVAVVQEAPPVVQLREDAPDKIVALLTKQDKATLGEAVLKSSKPVAEGGLGRDVIVALLEKYRPAGYTEKLVKLGAVEVKNYPAVIAAILDGYTVKS